MSIRVSLPEIPAPARVVLTLWNRFSRVGKVLRATRAAGLTSFHLGRLEDGFFMGTREPSFVVSLRGVSSTQLDVVARNLARAFHQLNVAVADFDSGETRFVDRG